MCDWKSSSLSRYMRQPSSTKSTDGYVMTSLMSSVTWTCSCPSSVSSFRFVTMKEVRLCSRKIRSPCTSGSVVGRRRYVLRRRWRRLGEVVMLDIPERESSSTEVTFCMGVGIWQAHMSWRLIARGRRSALTALLSFGNNLLRLGQALHPVVLSHCFLILVLAQGGGHSRLAFEGPGVTNHQAKQDRLRLSSASRQSYAKFEGQKKSVSSKGQAWSAAPSLMYPSSKQRNQGRLDLYEELFSNPSRNAGDSDRVLLGEGGTCLGLNWRMLHGGAEASPESDAPSRPTLSSIAPEVQAAAVRYDIMLVTNTSRPLTSVAYFSGTSTIDDSKYATTAVLCYAELALRGTNACSHSATSIVRDKN
ncbi:hypothetical protein KCU93_g457, partial [Aureobasidium melanogenum]